MGVNSHVLGKKDINYRTILIKNHDTLLTMTVKEQRIG